MAKQRVAISLHNLSSSKTSIRRAGIQQVVFQIARESLMNHHPDYDFIPIFHLPLANPANTPLYRPTHFNASKIVLEETLKELRISQADLIDRFPFIQLLIDGQIDAYEKECISQIASCDIFFETALADIRNVVDAAKQRNPNLQAGICVHDMVPMVYPEYIDDHMRGWFSIQYIECLHSVDFCVCVSRHTAIDTSHYMAPYAAVKDRIYYNSLPTPSPSEKQNKKNEDTLTTAYPQLVGKTILLSVATIEPRKNISFVLKAYKRFMDLFPELAKTNVLVLVGAKGWEDHKQMDQLISDLGTNVLVTGYITDELLSNFYQNASTCLMPSHYEGFGIPIAQARSHGTKIITCTNSSLPEASRLDALYTDPSNVDELACLIASSTRKNTATFEFNQTSYNQNWQDYFQNLLKIFQSTAQSQTTTSTTRKPIRSSNKLGFDISQTSITLANLIGKEVELEPHNFIAQISGAKNSFDLRADNKISRFYKRIQQNNQNDLPILPTPAQEQLFFDSLDYFILSSKIHINNNLAITNAIKRGLTLVSILPERSLSEDNQYLDSIIHWSGLIILEDEKSLQKITKEHRNRCIVSSDIFKPSENHLKLIKELIGGFNFA